jgi:molybdopterin converting factor small subunit
MPVTMHLPSVLRRMTDGHAKIPVDGQTVQEAVQQLCHQYPELGRHLLDDDGNVRSFVRIFVDQDDAASLQGPQTPLRDGQTLRVVPAIAGG